MMSPSSFAVFALKFLQKSMMLTPCGPSAVPTGGAGVAFPAAIWSFTIAWTFLAIVDVYFSSLAPGPHPRRELTLTPRLGFPCPRLDVAAGALNLLHLQEVEFHGRRAPENRDHDLQRVLVEVHLVDDAVEAGERPFVD